MERWYTFVQPSTTPSPRMKMVSSERAALGSRDWSRPPSVSHQEIFIFAAAKKPRGRVMQKGGVSQRRDTLDTGSSDHSSDSDTSADELAIRMHDGNLCLITAGQEVSETICYYYFLPCTPRIPMGGDASSSQP
eukprot:gene12050-10398_t